MTEPSASFPWLGESWKQLMSYVMTQRIPQALVIVGANGVGKSVLADCFAQLLLCQQQLAEPVAACGHCLGCQKFAAGTHPDLFVLLPQENTQIIGVDSIRRLYERLLLKPQYAAWRLAIIKSAESMNRSAANAFLKFLEEPTERTSVLLLVEQPARLPATILSRCQQLSIGLPSDQTLIDEWLKHQGIESCERALKLANGAPLLAKKMAEDNVPGLYEEFLHDWRQTGLGRVSAIRTAEKWEKQENIELSLLLRWVAVWLIESIKAVYAPDVISSGDDPLQQSVIRLNLQKTFRLYDTILEAIESCHGQLNKQLLLEQLLIDWKQLHEN